MSEILKPDDCRLGRLNKRIIVFKKIQLMLGRREAGSVCGPSAGGQAAKGELLIARIMLKPNTLTYNGWPWSTKWYLGLTHKHFSP